MDAFAFENILGKFEIWGEIWRCAFFSYYERLNCNGPLYDGYD